MPTTVQIDGVGEVEFPDSMSPDQITQTIRTKILAPKTETKTAKPEPKRGFLETLAAGMSPLGVPPTPDVGKGLAEEVQKPIKELPKPTWQEFKSVTGLSDNASQNLAALVNNISTPTVEFMESPAGMMTAGAGSVPGAASVVGGLFSAKALTSAPDTWRKVGELWEKAHSPNATLDDKMALKNAIAQAGMEGLVATAGAIPGARDLTGKLTPKAVQLANALKSEVDKAELPALSEPKPKLEAAVQTPEAQQALDIASRGKEAAQLPGGIAELAAKDVPRAIGEMPKIAPATAIGGARVEGLEVELGELHKQLQAAKIDGNADLITEIRGRMEGISRELLGLRNVGLENLEGGLPTAAQLGTFETKGTPRGSSDVTYRNPPSEEALPEANQPSSTPISQPPPETQIKQPALPEPTQTAAETSKSLEPVSSVERVPATENGGRIAIVLPNGTAIVGGRIHAMAWNKAVEQGLATDKELADGFAGFVKPDGTAWGVNGKPLPNVREVRIVDDTTTPKPPELPRQRPPQPISAGKEGETKTAQAAAAKVEDHVHNVVKTEGKRPAKEVKSELIQRLEQSIKDAPNEVDVQASSYTKVGGETVVTPDKAERVTIDIPGDGTFKIRNTKEALTGILKRAKAIEVAPTGKAPVKTRGIPRAITEETKAEISGQQKTKSVSEPSEGVGIISQPPKSLRNFAEQDVAPLVKKGVDAVKAAKNIIVETFSPTSKARSTDLDALMEAKGHKEQFSVQAAAAVEHAGEITSKLDPQQQIEFFDRGKTGQPQATPELQQINDLLRKWDDRLYDEATVYRPDLNYLDNHMRVLWQVVPGSPAAQARLAGQGMAPSQIQSIMSKRPWQGSKGFLKRHALDDMSQGIALGGVPVTTDPVRMFLLHAEDVMKFVAANRAFERLKDLGAVEFVKRSEKPPADYAKIDDRIADVYFRVPQGMVEAGKWWAQEDAARMINNYLSRDYIRGQGQFAPIGRALMGLKNGYTAVELSLSPFHAIFETIETVGSEIGRAIARATSGDPFGAAKELAKASFGPKTVATEGAMGIRYAKDPAAFKAQYPEAYKYFTSKYADADGMIKDLFTGGGTIKMWDDYRFKSADGMKKAWANDNVIGATIRAAPWLVAQAQKPLFEIYIPRLKVGMFLRDYAFELERNADKLANGSITRADLARKTWSFVEDRFGEMNFDNLYWNRTFKSAMQLLFRSVTWKLGNLRGFGKAAVDTVKFGNDLAHGIKPTVTLPMGWALGLTLTTATLGTVISKAFSGKYPWEWSKDDDSLAKDLTYPHISSTDPSQRVSIPTYVRDLVGMRKGLVEYGRSSMTGLWGKMADDWQNRDFYGTEVRHPGDPIGQQAADLAKHLFPVPFSISSAVKAEETGATTTQSALGFAGFTKAPYSISHTPAEIKASELIQSRMPKGARTREEFERSVQERRALESVKRGEMTVFDAVRSGLVTPQRAKEFEKKTVQTPLVNAIRHLPARESVEVYESGNDSEKSQIKTMVLMKIKRAWESKSITADEYKDMVQRVNNP